MGWLFPARRPFQIRKMGRLESLSHRHGTFRSKALRSSGIVAILNLLFPHALFFGQIHPFTAIRGYACACSSPPSRYNNGSPSWPAKSVPNFAIVH